MRRIIPLAAAAALAVAVQPAAAGGPLSSIFSCSSPGGKQEGGAVVGALLGGVIGNRVAGGDRGLGTVLGAAVGAAAGSYIGCRMQVGDQRRAEAATRDALERNRSASWSNPETGASGEVRITDSRDQNARPTSLAGLRFAPGVELAAAYESAGGRYVAAHPANVRRAPSSAAPVLRTLAPGEPVDALARAARSGWLLVGTGGVASGYVAEALLRRVGDPTLCRTFDQTIRTREGGEEVQRHTACRTADGDWLVQT